MKKMIALLVAALLAAVAGHSQDREVQLNGKTAWASLDMILGEQGSDFAAQREVIGGYLELDRGGDCIFLDTSENEPDRGTPEGVSSFVRQSRFVFEAEVLEVIPGMRGGAPYSLVRLAIDSLIKGPRQTPAVIDYLYPGIDTHVESEPLCVSNAVPRTPKVGDRLVLVARGAIREYGLISGGTQDLVLTLDGQSVEGFRGRSGLDQRFRDAQSLRSWLREEVRGNEGGGK